MKILIAYDGSTPADDAIADLRRAGLPTQAEARVICVADRNLASPHHVGSTAVGAEAGWTSKVAEAETLAEMAGEAVTSYFPQWTVFTETLWGSPAKIILQTSESWHPDLIVVGSHGRSRLERVLLGSVSLELVHKADCSVRVGRAGRSVTSRDSIRIVIGNDGSTEAEDVIRWVAARSWPAETEARIISVVQTLVPVPTGLEASTFAHEPAFTVIREADERQWGRLQNVAADSTAILRRAGLAASASVIDGDPGKLIVDAAENANADAIFVGARGLGKMQRLLLGSVSSHVVTHARCSVEIVKVPA